MTGLTYLWDQIVNNISDVVTSHNESSDSHSELRDICNFINGSISTEIGLSQSITAGNVVDVIDGKVYRYPKCLDAQQFTESGTATTQLTSAVLNDTSFIVAYQDDANASYGTVIVGTLNGDTITYGPKVVFNAASTSNVSVRCLVESSESDPRIIIAYTDVGNSSYGTAVIGTVSGTTVTFGSPYIFNDTLTASITILKRSSLDVVISYGDGSSQGTSKILTISGTTITSNSAYIFSTSITQHISMAKLTDTTFFVAYRGTSNYGRALVGTIDGSAISFGDESVFNAATTQFTTSQAIDTQTVSISYINQGGGLTCNTIVGKIDSTTITFNSAYIINANRSLYVSSSKIDTNKIVIAYRDSDQLKGHFALIVISGSLISGGVIDDYFNTAFMPAYVNVTSINNKVIIFYQNPTTYSRYSNIVKFPLNRAIALSSGVAGDTIPVAFDGTFKVPGITKGTTITSDGATAYSPHDGMLSVKGYWRA